MAASYKTVALLVANPALSSILAGTLAGAPSLRVRPFESRLALLTYLRLAPADLVVVDLDGGVGDAAAELRGDPLLAERPLQVIALAGENRLPNRSEAMAAGYDEVIAKPMSPRYLVERVLARLARTPAPTLGRRSLRRRDWSTFGENVVPLFPTV